MPKVELKPRYENDSFHWFHSERAHTPAIAQWVQESWYCINEAGSVDAEEMRRRGWDYLGPVAPHPFSAYLGH